MLSDGTPGAEMLIYTIYHGGIIGKVKTVCFNQSGHDKWHY